MLWPSGLESELGYLYPMEDPKEGGAGVGMREKRWDTQGRFFRGDGFGYLVEVLR